MPSSAETPLDGELESENDKSASPAKADTPPVLEICVNCPDAILESRETHEKIVDALRNSCVLDLNGPLYHRAQGNDERLPGSDVANLSRYFVLLARITRITSSHVRKGKQVPNSRIEACCRAALILDPANERGMIEYAWELYRRKEYANVVELKEYANVVELNRGSCSMCEEWNKLIERTKTERNEISENNCLTADSPVKDIRDIGVKTAKQVSPNKNDANVKICDAVFSENDNKERNTKKKAKVKEIQKSLVNNLDLKKLLSDDLLDEIKGLLEPPEGKFKVVSWNARASLPTHCLTPEVLAKKAKNLANAARDQDASIVCVQECPGQLITKKGGDVAKGTVEGETSFCAALNFAIPYFEVRSIAIPGTNDSGETHVVAWDPLIWVLDPASENPKPLEHQGLSRAIGRTMLCTKAEPVKRLALLSCHLKSGGQGPTKQDLDTLCTHILPNERASLQPVDAVLVIGDFNLEPTDIAFKAMKDLGFQNIGNRDGVSTNQSDFTFGEGGKIYDSAWLWRSDAATGSSSGVVLEFKDVQKALDERNQMLDVFKGVYDQIEASSEIGISANAILLGDGKGSIAQAVKAAFKNLVFENFSDHKPICVEVALS